MEEKEVIEMNQKRDKTSFFPSLLNFVLVISLKNVYILRTKYST